MFSPGNVTQKKTTTTEPTQQDDSIGRSSSRQAAGGSYEMQTPDELGRRQNPPAGDIESGGVRGVPKQSLRQRTGSVVKKAANTLDVVGDTRPSRVRSTFLMFNTSDDVRSGPKATHAFKQSKPEPHQYDVEVPNTHAGRMDSAKKAVEQAQGFEPWIAARPSSGGTRTTANERTKMDQIGDVAKDVAVGLGKVTGFTARDIPTAADVAALDKSGQGGHANLMHHVWSDINHTKAKLTEAKYGADGISIELGKFAAYLKADVPAQAAAVDRYLADHAQASKTVHDLRASQNATASSADAQQIRKSLASAEKNLTQLQANPPAVGDDWAPRLKQLLGLQDRSLQSLANAEHSVGASTARLTRVQDTAVQDLLDKQPGIHGRLDGLTQSFQALADRLLAQPRSNKKLGPDEVLGRTMQEMVQVFGTGEGSKRQMNQALQGLSQMDASELAGFIAAQAAGGAPDKLKSPGLKLAASLVRLPRGDEMVGHLLKQSNFLSPADAELKERRNVAMQYMLVLHRQLTEGGAGLSTENREHLERARDAVTSALARPDCDMTKLPDASRHAFNCVMHDLYEKGTDTKYDKISGYLTAFGKSAAPATGVLAAVAGYAPVMAPTAFNSKALEAAAKALREGKLIDDSSLALGALHEASNDLRGAAGTTHEKALKAVADAVLAAVPRNDARPERIGSLTNADVPAIPQYFGLTKAEIDSGPMKEVKALWDRHAGAANLGAVADGVGKWMTLNDPDAIRGLQKKDIPDHFGLGAEAVDADPRLKSLWAQKDQLAPSELGDRLAKIARDDLLAATKTHPGETLRTLAALSVDAIEAQKASAKAQKAPEGAQKALASAQAGAADFLAKLDMARASGIWESGKVNTPAQLAESFVALVRTMKLRGRMKLSGSNIIGFDLAKIPLSTTGAGSAVTGNLRADVGGKAQWSMAIELAYGTSAYGLSIGYVTSVGGKGGFGGGASASGKFALGKTEEGQAGARFIDGGFAASGEYQWQKGLRLVNPRDKTTESRDRGRFEDAVRQAALWEHAQHPDPVHAITTGADTASLNLFGEAYRSTLRSEVSLGLSPFQLGLGPIQGRVAVGGKTSAESRWSVLREDTGYFRSQEYRLDRNTLQQLGEQATMAVRLKKSGGEAERKTNVNAADLFGHNRNSDWPESTAAIMRIVTMHGKTLPTRSRFITNHSEQRSLRQGMEGDKARWSQHGIDFPQKHYPDTFTDSEKRQDTARLYDQWVNAPRPTEHGKFSEYADVKCLTADSAIRLDGLNAQLMQATSARVAARHDEPSTQEKDLSKQITLLLGDAKTWEPRRSSDNVRTFQSKNPGFNPFGIQSGSGGDIEVIRNTGLWPPT